MPVQISRCCWLVVGCLFAGMYLCGSAVAHEDASARPNVLIITVDDMSCDSVGAFGCELPDTTPHIDRLASRGLRYHYAHVQVGNCYPSRNVLFSGRYPHNTGVEGFYQVKDPQYPHLVDLMKSAGYLVGICGKVSHSTPYQPYAWDIDLSTTTGGKRMDIKSPKSYYDATRRGIELAKSNDKPFCLNINVSDPHKPFYAMNGRGQVVDDKNVPSRVFQPEEVPIPGFLFDHPDVRLELSHYYSSVRRADDCVGLILKALKESQLQDNTIVIFLSDHGMPLPFAKTALWHHSTRTPWIVVWPGVTRPGSVDKNHMISAVDLMPTLLDIIDVEHPEGFDGRSFLPTIRGQQQPERELVYKVYNENSGGNRSPMRSVESKRFGYLFNPWSDGTRVFRTATTGTLSYRAMTRLAETDPAMAARLKHFKYNVPEEFYDYEKDPDALNNLIDNPDYRDEIQRHQAAMRQFMKQSHDPLLEVFEQRGDPAARSAYVDKVQAESDRRRAQRRKTKNNSKGNKPEKSKKLKNLFQLELPQTVQAGQAMTVSVKHQLPNKLGKQSFHVTLKDGANQRITRVVKQVSGQGQFSVEFQVPESVKLNSVIVATFVGEDFDRNLMHVNSKPIKVSQ